MKFLGHIICPRDGFTYIKDPNQVTIYFCHDASGYLTEVRCEECGGLVSVNIDPEFLLAFRSHGVGIQPYSSRFDPLTEELIKDWNIEKDLKSLYDERKEYKL